MDVFLQAKNAKRLVIDSLSLLSMYTNILEDPDHIQLMDLSVDVSSKIPVDPLQLRSQTIYHLLGKVKALGTTALLTVEQVEPDRLTKDGVSEFACDGLIILKKIMIGKDVMRSIIVEKMRETNVNAGTHAMEFGPSGVVVK